MMKNKDAFSIWLIGPSASGKTTVSEKIYELLSANHKNIVLLDGDHARKILNITPTGLSPSMVSFSKLFRLFQYCYWPVPRSLATTNGISIDFFSSGYLDVSVLRVSSSNL